MFLKNFKVKSNVQIKNSDNKKIFSKLCVCYPTVDELEFTKILSNKSQICLIKIILSNGNICNVYTVDKKPMLFEDENGFLLPTIYSLWIIPKLLQYLTTQPAVLPKLSNGADLMLPGIVKTGQGLQSYGHFKKGQLIAINTTENNSAIGVGRLLKSSEDLYMSGGHGIGVKILHVFGDRLWGLEPTCSLPIPLGEPVINFPLGDNDFPELGINTRSKNSTSPTPESNETQTLIHQNTEKLSKLELQEANKEQDLKVESMDDVLKNAFLAVIKLEGKNLSLPMLTSTFYRLYVVPFATKPIDLKQTSYKKLSKFLNEMSDRGIIVVQEATKGVEKITSIDFEHSDVVNFIPTGCDTDKINSNKSNLFHSTMTELYIVNEKTAPLFLKMNCRIGEGIEKNQIRKLLKEYISKNQLKIDNITRCIMLDLTLCDICDESQLSFDDLFKTVLTKMSHTFGMICKNEIESNKPIIRLSLANRAGNKKVTLVSNLEAHGIIVSEFAKTCKLGAAASTSFIKTPNQKHDQLQIQGNQIKFIHKLLTETYKIPLKYISGLELQRKEKKKK